MSDVSSANLRRRAEDTSEFHVILEIWNRQIRLLRQAATGGIVRNPIAEYAGISVAQVSSRILCGAGLSVMTALRGAQTTSSLAVLGLPSDGDIRRILPERVDAQGKGVGIIVGVTWQLDELAKAKYSAAQLYQFLARYELPQQSGAKWDYSSIGYSLLGQALPARAGMDYETLLRTRVIAPLELKGTGITLVPKLKAKLAVDHDGSLQPAPPISTVPRMAVMMPAGGVGRSRGSC